MIGLCFEPLLPPSQKNVSLGRGRRGAAGADQNEGEGKRWGGWGGTPSSQKKKSNLRWAGVNLPECQGNDAGASTIQKVRVFFEGVSWEVINNQAVQRYSVRDLGRDSPVLCLHCHQSFCSRSLCTTETSRTSFELLVSCFLLRTFVLSSWS